MSGQFRTLPGGSGGRSRVWLVKEAFRLHLKKGLVRSNLIFFLAQHLMPLFTTPTSRSRIYCHALAPSSCSASESQHSIACQTDSIACQTDNYSRLRYSRRDLEQEDCIRACFPTLLHRLPSNLHHSSSSLLSRKIHPSFISNVFSRALASTVCVNALHQHHIVRKIAPEIHRFEVL